MPARLTSYEKETIMLTSEGDTEFIIDTFNTGYKKRLDKFCKEHPSLCYVQQVRPDGSVKYCLRKECYSFRLIAPYTEERRQKSREQAKKNGLIRGKKTDDAPAA